MNNDTEILNEINNLKNKNAFLQNFSKTMKNELAVIRKHNKKLELQNKELNRKLEELLKIYKGILTENINTGSKIDNINRKMFVMDRNEQALINNLDIINEKIHIDKTS